MDLLHKPKWDEERLGYLSKPLDLHGKKISKKVIQDVSPVIAKCQVLDNLLPSLYSRNVITDKDLHNLKLETADGTKLFSALVSASCETVGRGEHLVRNLYLALLDASLDYCDVYCRNVALTHLRETAVKHLQTHMPDLPTEEPKDLRSVVARFSDVTLSPETAFQLRQNLKLPRRSVENTSLKKILVEYSAKCSDVDNGLLGLVKTMMLTRGVGRYVSKLLPFYQSYSVEVLTFFSKRLGHLWTEYAAFLGFTAKEIHTVKSYSDGIEGQEPRHFLKVWRMPDLQSKDNNDILYSVLPKAGINIDTQRVPLVRAVSEPKPSSHPPQKRLTQSYHGDTHRPSHYQELHSPNVVSGQLNGSSEHYSTDSGMHMPSSQWSSMSDDAMSEGSSLFFRQPSYYTTVPEGSESPLSSPDHLSVHPKEPELVDSVSHFLSPCSLALSSQANPAHKYPSQGHPLPMSQPASPHPTSLEPQEQTRAHQYQEQMVATQLQMLHLCSSQTSNSTELQTLGPNDEVLDLSKSLGRGLYGEVWEVKGQCYAAKEYHTPFIKADKLKIKFSEELLSLKLKHENIVTYCGVARITGTKRTVVVMERVHQNLKAVLEGQRELEPAKKLSILSNVADGLAYLHSKDIVHCDLVPNNVLLTRELTAKVTDYGNVLVREISETAGCPKAGRLKDYLPQEALEGRDCTPSLDAFSFGHLSIYTMLQRQPHPLKGYYFKQNGELVARTEVERREDYIDEMQKNISGGLLEPLLTWTIQCLDDDPDARPQLREFSAHFKVFC